MFLERFMPESIMEARAVEFELLKHVGQTGFGPYGLVLREGLCDALHDERRGLGTEPTARLADLACPAYTDLPEEFIQIVL